MRVAARLWWPPPRTLLFSWTGFIILYKLWNFRLWSLCQQGYRDYVMRVSELFMVIEIGSSLFLVDQ
jgi:hypothetical protein